MELENITIFGLLAYIAYNLTVNSNKKTTSSSFDSDKSMKLEFDKKYSDLQNKLLQKSELLNTLIDNYNKLLEKKQNDNSTVIIDNSIVKNPSIDFVDIRDNRVLNDKLYPPISRDNRPSFDMLINNPMFHGMPTRFPYNMDTFRPIAYGDINGKKYYIMGRSKDNRSGLGEYYLTSTDRNDTLKIPLVDDRNRPLIKNFYDIPSVLDINGENLINIKTLPNSDLTSPYI
jgi:uncharacterized membrane-anchored protein YhcB (DUF1043 family)